MNALERYKQMEGALKSLTGSWVRREKDPPRGGMMPAAKITFTPRARSKSIPHQKVLNSERPTIDHVIENNRRPGLTPLTLQGQRINPSHRSIGGARISALRSARLARSHPFLWSSLAVGTAIWIKSMSSY